MPAAEDDQLLRDFESCTLPFTQWTHRMHVKVTYLYLQRNSFDDAIAKLRTGIRKYNAANKVEESATSGYNETTTRAMIHLIAAVMRAYAKTHPVSDGDSFCEMHPELMSKHVLRFFYSPQQRMKPNAKTEFVPPDLTELPKIFA